VTGAVVEPEAAADFEHYLAVDVALVVEDIEQAYLQSK
jgi:hypothetical protein